jgi:hypothetical protein
MRIRPGEVPKTAIAAVNSDKAFLITAHSGVTEIGGSTPN